MTMGDRDYRELIRTAVSSISKELEIEIDATDINTIHLEEVVSCLRRSYFDRIDPIEQVKSGFNQLLSGFLQKMDYGGKSGEYDLEDIKLKGKADMMVDDAAIIFRPTFDFPENPKASDLLYLNACLWIFNKVDGIIVYLTGDRKEESFSVTKSKKMFEETVRRVRVLHDMLEAKKIPIIEPSHECDSCQYYERCFVKQKIGRTVSIKDIVGLGK